MRDIDIIDIYIDFDENNIDEFTECVRSIINHTTAMCRFISLPKTLINKFTQKPIINDSINYSMFLIPSLNGLTGFALYLNSNIMVDYDINELWKQRDVRYDIQFFGCDIKKSGVVLWNCNGFPHRKLNDDVLQTANADYLKSLDWLNQERIDYIIS